jgi:peroxiredoxin
MTIEVGSELPNVDIFLPRPNEIRVGSIAKLTADKRVAMFGVPGAFTPVCTQTHAPGFVEEAARLKDMGIDDVICIAPNDPFVTQAWARTLKGFDVLTFVADWAGEFTQAIGMHTTSKMLGLKDRSKRYALIADNGVVTTLKLEDEITTCDISSAQTLIEDLQGRESEAA